MWSRVSNGLKGSCALELCLAPPASAWGWGNLTDGNRGQLPHFLLLIAFHHLPLDSLCRPGFPWTQNHHVSASHLGSDDSRDAANEVMYSPQLLTGGPRAWTTLQLLSIPSRMEECLMRPDSPRGVLLTVDGTGGERSYCIVIGDLLTLQ